MSARQSLAQPSYNSRIDLTKDGLHYKNWRFELPRRGRTVLVRNQKSGKILHKFTWNGEKFREEK